MSCKICGAPKSVLTETGRCKNRSGCNQRRVERRIAEDRKREGRQCMASIGSRSIRFCTLREGHEGLHAQGVTEWGNEEETNVGRAFAAVLRHT